MGLLAGFISGIGQSYSRRKYEERANLHETALRDRDLADWKVKEEQSDRLERDRLKFKSDLELDNQKIRFDLSQDLLATWVNEAYSNLPEDQRLYRARFSKEINLDFDKSWSWDDKAKRYIPNTIRDSNLLLEAEREYFKVNSEFYPGFDTSPAAKEIQLGRLEGHSLYTIIDGRDIINGGTEEVPIWMLSDRPDTPTFNFEAQANTASTRAVDRILSEGYSELTGITFIQDINGRFKIEGADSKQLEWISYAKDQAYLHTIGATDGGPVSVEAAAQRAISETIAKYGELGEYTDDRFFKDAQWETLKAEILNTNPDELDAFELSDIAQVIKELQDDSKEQADKFYGSLPDDMRFEIDKIFDPELEDPIPKPETIPERLRAVQQQRQATIDQEEIINQAQNTLTKAETELKEYNEEITKAEDDLREILSRHGLTLEQLLDPDLAQNETAMKATRDTKGVFTLLDRLEKERKAIQVVIDELQALLSAEPSLPNN